MWLRSESKSAKADRRATQGLRSESAHNGRAIIRPAVRSPTSRSARVSARKASTPSSEAAANAFVGTCGLRQLARRGPTRRYGDAITASLYGSLSSWSPSLVRRASAKAPFGRMFGSLGIGAVAGKRDVRSARISGSSEPAGAAPSRFVKPEGGCMPRTAAKAGSLALRVSSSSPGRSTTPPKCSSASWRASSSRRTPAAQPGKRSVTRSA